MNRGARGAGGTQAGLLIGVRNSVCNATRTGRPRCTSSKQDRRIVRRSKADPRLTAVDIATEFNMNEGTNLSRQTVGRRLKDAGIHGRRPAKKPFISSKNRRAREWSSRAVTSTGLWPTGAEFFSRT
ncbi:transposase, partial [Ostertagia ostertagi]